MKLEIVSHCWHYSRLLTYHLSSLILYPPKHVEVTMTVFLTEEDEDTCNVLRWFSELDRPANVVIRGWYLPREKLFCRGIGRNMAALATKADWIWFADCDFVFGNNALDTLPGSVEQCDSPLVFPKYVQTSISHKIGDDTIAQATGDPRILAIDKSHFKRERLNRATGGIQIARGDSVRQLGYCKDWCGKQGTPEKWLDSREDMRFRRTLNTRGMPIDMPGLYRIRHSTRGCSDMTARL